MNHKEWAGTRAGRSLLIVLCVLAARLRGRDGDADRPVAAVAGPGLRPL